MDYSFYHLRQKRDIRDRPVVRTKCGVKTGLLETGTNYCPLLRLREYASRKRKVN